jgi:hypothetical protein
MYNISFKIFDNDQITIMNLYEIRKEAGSDKY